MKKTPVVFLVDDKTGLASAQVRPGQEWVLAGEGVATLKIDGSACRWHEGRLWKRFDRKLNKAAQRRWDRGEPIDPTDITVFRDPPDGFEPCEAAPDPVTFHWPGWMPVSPTDPADQWHREALAHWPEAERQDGTYELVGPSVALNPYGLARHTLRRHGAEVLSVPRDFEGLQAWLAAHEVEGLVFHHPDGRMAKLRRKDFGLFWVQEPPVRRPRRKM